MKTYYLFTRDAESFSFDTVLIYLSVGSSTRSLIKLRLLERYCMDCGFFLRVRDADTDFFVEEQAKKLRPDSNCPQLWLRSASMSVESFYRMVIDGRLDSFEASLDFTKGQFHLLPLVDEKYCHTHSFSDKSRFAPFCKRKNLSHNYSDDFVSTAVSLAVLILLFFIEAAGASFLGLE